MPDAAQADELRAPAMNIVYPHIFFAIAIQIPGIKKLIVRILNCHTGGKGKLSEVVEAKEV